jgi:hypothetical protein
VKGHQRMIGDAIQRSIGRGRAVESPDHLPDAARDAYLLAQELKTLQQRVEVLRRFQIEVQRTARSWVR